VARAHSHCRYEGCEGLSPLPSDVLCPQKQSPVSHLHNSKFAIEVFLIVNDEAVKHMTEKERHYIYQVTAAQANLMQTINRSLVKLRIRVLQENPESELTGGAADRGSRLAWSLARWPHTFNWPPRQEILRQSRPRGYRRKIPHPTCTMMNGSRTSSQI
jgi:hypothetical protein